ncbi:hypothetical protein BMS3Bbin02_01359 [bacterium BMS3Bbin02]|nr:hypothetical protein BMS3Bbin02_01359 [bacterium BMS3Bbin02]
MGLVAEPIDERWTQGTVEQAARESRPFCGATFAAEERTGDPPDGIHTLFNVDRKGEEICTVTHRAFRGGCREDLGITNGDHDGPIGELGKFARRHGDIYTVNLLTDAELCHASLLYVLGEDPIGSEPCLNDVWHIVQPPTTDN